MQVSEIGFGGEWITGWDQECAQTNTGITVMKPFAGGRLLDGEKSSFGVSIAQKMAEAAQLLG